MSAINTRIARELNVQVGQVAAAVELIGEGATVPFIARYRKEKTGGLDDTQLRKLEERLHYLRQLDERRATVLKAINEQGKLTPELERDINAATDKVTLEDLYAPFKQKRRTKAQMAREAGLEPLTNALLEDPTLDPAKTAAPYVRPDAGIADSKAALDGARSILVERISEDAKLVGDLREWLWSNGKLTSTVAKGKETAGAKFSDYFTFSQDIRQTPSHRALALLRGRNEEILVLTLDVERPDNPKAPHPAVLKIMVATGIADHARAADSWLIDSVKIAWRSRLHPSLTSGLLTRLKEVADAAAIDVFNSNLKDLLLAAPAGARTTIGLDPGFRTGVKTAVVDKTGKLLETSTIYPHEPRNDWSGSLAALAALCTKHDVELIAIGNGTASRETERLVSDLITQLRDKKLTKVMVSEAGASIYSASQLAADEFPDLDVALRGAVSIARRLQDPLAELVKIEPKAIGVGQYQHDVNQSDLAHSLTAAVEDCVNAVGVDINTASAALLTNIAGLNATIARNIVAHRNDNGPFKKRTEIKKVARLGPKAFEQSAGFLRIMNAKNLLDSSAVHPEAYAVVERIAKATNRSLKSMIGDTAFLKSLRPEEYADDQFGVPTIADILAELEKPGRDPRPEFSSATFADGIDEITDVKPGMRLEGVVTNVTAFGAFVDIGVHQDGLVHISEMADRFVKDPREIVKAGDVVKVRVKDVDVSRKRIGLTMKSGNIDRSSAARAPAPNPRSTAPITSAPEPPGESALAAALRKAQRNA